LITRSPLSLAFIDLKWAYGSINRAKLWKVMVESLKIPPDLVLLIRNTYVQSKGIIKGMSSDELFEYLINMGIKQGDGASPELFILFFDRIYPYI
jgi:Reverse transcriptase (RNA-dependent DNA polymerase)